MPKLNENKGNTVTYLDTLRNRLYFSSHNSVYHGYYDITNDIFNLNPFRNIEDIPGISIRPQLIPDESITNTLFIVKDKITNEWHTVYGHDITFDGDDIVVDGVNYSYNTTITQTENIGSLAINFNESTFVNGEYYTIPVTDSPFYTQSDALETWNIKAIGRYKNLFNNNNELHKQYNSDIFGIGNSHLISNIERNNTNLWAIKRVKSTPPAISDVTNNYSVNMCSDHLILEYIANIGRSSSFSTWDTTNPIILTKNDLFIPVPKRITYEGTEYITDMRRVSVRDNYGTVVFGFTDSPPSILPIHLQNDDISTNFYYIRIAWHDMELSNKTYYVYIEKTTISDLLPLDLTLQNFMAQSTPENDVLKVNLPFVLPNTINIRYNETSTDLDYTLSDEFGLNTNWSNQIYVKLPSLPAGTLNSGSVPGRVYTSLQRNRFYSMSPHSQLEASKDNDFNYDYYDTYPDNTKDISPLSPNYIFANNNPTDVKLNSSTSNVSGNFVEPSDNIITISNTVNVNSELPNDFFDFYWDYSESLSSKFILSDNFNEDRNVSRYPIVGHDNSSTFTNMITSSDIYNRDDVHYVSEMSYSIVDGNISSNPGNTNIYPYAMIESNAIGVNINSSYRREHRIAAAYNTLRLQVNPIVNRMHFSIDFNNVLTTSIPVSSLSHRKSHYNVNLSFNRSSQYFGRKLSLGFSNSRLNIKSVKSYQHAITISIKEIDYTREYKLPINAYTLNNNINERVTSHVSELVSIKDSNDIDKNNLYISNIDLQKPLWMNNYIKGYYLKDFSKDQNYYTWLNSNTSRPTAKVYSYYIDANELKTNYDSSNTSSLVVHPQGYINPFMSDYNDVNSLIIGYPFPPNHSESTVSPIIDIGWLKDIYGDDLSNFRFSGIEHAYLPDETNIVTPTTSVSNTVTNTILIKDQIFTTRSTPTLPTYSNDGFSLLEQITDSSRNEHSGIIYIPYESNRSHPPILYNVTVDNTNNTFNSVYYYNNANNYTNFNSNILSCAFYGYSYLYLKSYFSQDFLKYNFLLQGKTFNLPSQGLGKSFALSSWMYQYPRPVPGIIPLTTYPTTKDSEIFNKEYTINSSSEYTPSDTSNVHGVYTPYVDLQTKFQRRMSDVYWSNPIDISKIDYIGNMDVNISGSLEEYNIRDHHQYFYYYNIFKITNKTDNTDKYYILNKNRLLEEITDLFTSNSIEAIRTKIYSTRFTDSLTRNLDYLNDFFDDKKTVDDENDGNYEFSIGTFFYLNKENDSDFDDLYPPNVNPNDNNIFQFYGISLFIEFNDNSMYKEIDWAYYNVTTDTITDSPSSDTDTIIIKPTIATWLKVISDSSGVSNADAFDTTKEFVFPYPTDVLFAGGFLQNFEYIRDEAN